MNDRETRSHANPTLLNHPWLAPAVIVATAISMLLWTWGRYCDPLIDFGRELYIAWRVSAGDVLYRDIDYFNGPVSPYLNALIFRIFGVSLLSLEIANLLWWIILVALAWRLYILLSDRLAALVAMLLFVTLFSFIQLTNIANDNFITPYSHEITHAFVCSYALLMLLWQYLRDPAHRLRFLAGCGLLMGVIFLMKVEITTAAGAALAVGVTASLISRRATFKTWLASLSLIFVSTALPLLVAFLLLKVHLPTRQALEGMLGSWKYLGERQITSNTYYRSLIGTDRLRENLQMMLCVLACELLALLPPAIVALVVSPRGKSIERSQLIVGAGIYIAVIFGLFFDANTGWASIAKPLNLAAVVAVSAFLIAGIRNKFQPSPRLILQLAFSVFSLALLAKTFFAISISHYGFVLTAPVFALTVMSLVCWIPRWIDSRSGTGNILRAAAIIALACFAFRHLLVYETNINARPVQAIGVGADAFDAARNGYLINSALNSIRGLPPGDTVATIPEGVMLNYQTRRVNPTGELLLLPGEVAMFGEPRVLRQFTLHPPDWIVLLPTNLKTFGSAGFGVDYAHSVAQFIVDNYDQTDGLLLPDGTPSAIHLLRHDPGHQKTGKSAAIPLDLLRSESEGELIRH